MTHDMDRICSMIGIALIFMLAISLCKDYKMSIMPQGTACSMASRQTTSGVSAKASLTEATPALEGVGGEDVAHPMSVGPLTESAWNMNKELTASEKLTGKALDEILNIDNTESFDKQMTQSSCNTSKHTYEKIVSGQSVMRPSIQAPTHSRQLGQAGLLNTVLTIKGEQTIAAPTTALWFNEPAARVDAMKRVATA